MVITSSIRAMRSPPNVARTRECAAHIAPPRIVLQAHLRRGVADALTAVGVERETESLRHLAGDFGGVVEAALADACWHAAAWRSGGRGWGWVATASRKTFAQRRRDGELAVIFQARNQAVERKRIGQRRAGAVERGRVLEAGAAHLAAGRGDGALRALRLAVPGQVGLAGGAQVAGSGCRAAQQAGARAEICLKIDLMFNLWVVLI